MPTSLRNNVASAQADQFLGTDQPAACGELWSCSDDRSLIPNERGIEEHAVVHEDGEYRGAVCALQAISGVDDLSAQSCWVGLLILVLRRICPLGDGNPRILQAVFASPADGSEAAWRTAIIALRTGVGAAG